MSTTSTPCTCTTELDIRCPLHREFAALAAVNAHGKLQLPDRGDFVNATADAAYDRGFRAGIEAAMKLLGGK